MPQAQNDGAYEGRAQPARPAFPYKVKGKQGNRDLSGQCAGEPDGPIADVLRGLSSADLAKLTLEFITPGSGVKVQ